MDRNGVIIRAENRVRELYKAHLNDTFVYHNLEHVELVVKAAKQISNHYNLHGQDYQAVLVAAWFHDVGYLFGCTADHEDKSVEQATEFLKEQNENPGLAEKVKECIRATKIFSEPSSLIAKIVSDADLFHLGTPHFLTSNKQILEEMKLCFGKTIPSDKWHRMSLTILEKHRYHTDYCQNLLQIGKQENIDFLREWLEGNGEKSSGTISKN